jgi:hypothetical protein
VAKSKITTDGRTITVRVPISIRRRGGRKVVLAPDGMPGGSTLRCRGIDRATIKAIARSFRWREMLENGTHATIAELAHAEHIDRGYVGRILRLTLLAPDIVETIVTGRQLGTVTLAVLMQPFPMDWDRQGFYFQLFPAKACGAAVDE